MKIGRRHLPDLFCLQAFECAARHGSFTRAADELNLTQSAVSRQVKELERNVGALLFERVRQRVVLSEQGRRLLPQARKLLRQSEELMLGAKTASGSGTTLNVATLPTFGSRWLGRRLPDFVARHPDIALNVGSRSQPFDFDDENFDLAIHYGKPVWPRATCTFLCTETIVPVASPALLAEQPIATPQDLLQAPLLHLATRPQLWPDWFEKAGTPAPRVLHGHRFDEFSMLIEAVLCGMGHALLPLYLIERERASGDLSAVLEQSISTENSYFVVIPEAKQTLAAGIAFAAWLQTQISSEGRRAAG